MLQGRYTIISKNELQTGIFDMLLSCPELAESAKAGQFLHILCGEKILRRPISICEVQGENLRIVFEVRGEGTAWLTQCKAGEALDILGPAGNGFPVSAFQGKKTLVIGGGIGVPPLLETAKAFKGKADAILGYRNRDAVILEQDFNAVCEHVTVTTDNGSYREKGFVTDVLQKRVLQTHYDVIFTCGPTVMMQNVAEFAREKGIACYVSLEERMGCGVGACLVCACKIARENGEAQYLHVCKDGPAFDAKEVCFA